MQLVPFFALPFIWLLTTSENMEPANFQVNLAYFLSGITGVSLLAIPIVQAHLGAISDQALWLALLGNAVAFGYQSILPCLHIVCPLAAHATHISCSFVFNCLFGTFFFTLIFSLFAFNNSGVIAFGKVMHLADGVNSGSF